MNKDDKSELKCGNTFTIIISLEFSLFEELDFASVSLSKYIAYSRALIDCSDPSIGTSIFIDLL